MLISKTKSEAYKKLKLISSEQHSPSSWLSRIQLRSRFCLLTHSKKYYKVLYITEHSHVSLLNNVLMSWLTSKWKGERVSKNNSHSSWFLSNGAAVHDRNTTCSWPSCWTHVLLVRPWPLTQNKTIWKWQLTVKKAYIKVSELILRWEFSVGERSCGLHIVRHARRRRRGSRCLTLTPTLTQLHARKSHLTQALHGFGGVWGGGEMWARGDGGVRCERLTSSFRSWDWWRCCWWWRKAGSFARGERRTTRFAVTRKHINSKVTTSVTQITAHNL